jgi:hypothetical protein
VLSIEHSKYLPRSSYNSDLLLHIIRFSTITHRVGCVTSPFYQQCYIDNEYCDHRHTSSGNGFIKLILTATFPTAELLHSPSGRAVFFIRNVKTRHCFVTAVLTDRCGEPSEKSVDILHFRVLYVYRCSALALIVQCGHPSQ